MIRYARITLAQGDPFFIKIKSETLRFLTGVEVDREGDAVTSPGVDEKLHLIEVSELKKRVDYRMNLMYARLERCK